MNRVVCLIVSLGLMCSLFSIDFVTQTNNKQTTVYMMIPFDSFIWAAESDVVKYQFKVSINNSNKENVYQNIFDINLDKKQIQKGAAYLKTIDLNLTEGKYQINTQLRNPMLGDKQEKKFEFEVNYKKPPGDTALLVADNGQYQFVPANIEQLNKSLKSADLILDFAPEVDSLVINIETESGPQRIILYPPQGKMYNLLPILQNTKILSLRLKYYSANIIYQSETMLNQNRFRYNQIYTLQDQLQQIRYIATQNEWKSIRHTPPDKLSTMLENFWERHNSNPGSKDNTTRDIFYDRVIKADELFTIHKKMKGWKSDRGMVYIKYGPPDEITEEIYPIGQYPYINWHYYQDYKVYHFVDKSGFGNYQLMEVDDEN